jgi:Zn-finger nucleic acid-binding protein
MSDCDVNGRAEYVRLLYRPCTFCYQEVHVKDLVDDACPRCRGVEADESELAARQRLAARKLHLETAEMLYQMARGTRDERLARYCREGARIHEEEAERE